MYRSMALLLIVFCFGCFEDPFSSDSEKGAPESIIGYQIMIVVTENDGKPSTRSVGDPLTYQFIDRHTIRGEGIGTVNTVSWSYSASGNTARVHLQYDGGEENYVLTFTSESAGTLEYNGEVYGSILGWFRGTFTISPI